MVSDGDKLAPVLPVFPMDDAIKVRLAVTVLPVLHETVPCLVFFEVGWCFVSEVFSVVLHAFLVLVREVPDFELAVAVSKELREGVRPKTDEFVCRPLTTIGTSATTY